MMFASKNLKWLDSNMLPNMRAYPRSSGGIFSSDLQRVPLHSICLQPHAEKQPSKTMTPTWRTKTRRYTHHRKLTLMIHYLRHNKDVSQSASSPPTLDVRPMQIETSCKPRMSMLTVSDVPGKRERYNTNNLRQAHAPQTQPEDCVPGSHSQTCSSATTSSLLGLPMTAPTRTQSHKHSAKHCQAQTRTNGKLRCRKNSTAY